MTKQKVENKTLEELFEECSQAINELDNAAKALVEKLKERESEKR